MSRGLVSKMSKGFQGLDPPPGRSPQTRVTRLETGHRQRPWFPRPVPGLATRPQVSGQRWGARLSQRRCAWPQGATGSTQPTGLQGAGGRAVRAALDPAARCRADPPTNRRLPQQVPSCPLATPWPRGTCPGETHIWGFSSKQPARPLGSWLAQRQGLSGDSLSWAAAYRWGRRL